MIHFRWSPPAKSNGELTGYRIHFCHEIVGTLDDDCQNIDVLAGVTEFIAPNLIIYDNYTFTVGYTTQFENKKKKQQKEKYSKILIDSEMF